MAFSIQTNVNSMNAQENLRMNQEFQSRTINRLTSGYRINSSADDAAGMSVANKYRNDVTSLMQGVRNANDGISTLQIVDGGLNNVSKILDRMTTLATQSATATFEGDRSILQTEYASLIGEINRQASNVGLSSSNATSGRYNKDISVFIGGGSTASNSGVSVDLSGAGNLIDSTGLNLTSTTIAGSTQLVVLSAADYSTGKVLDLNTSQEYTFNNATGAHKVNLQGDTDGLTGNEIVNQLNSGLAGTGISVSMNASNGKLQVSSSGAFSISVTAKVGAGAQVQAAVASTAAIVNTGTFNFNGGTVSTSGAADQVLSFTPAGGSAINVTLTGTNTADQTFNALRAGLAGSGIDVIRSGSDVSFQSAKDFSVSRDATVSTGGIANVAASSNASATDKLNSSDPTADGASALVSLQAAVSKLGAVQGKVGTGLNKLQYAIQLAQSQISNFSAAESRIRDADVASEAANLTKAQVLQQASMAAMAQANSAPQAILSLLRG